MNIENLDKSPKSIYAKWTDNKKLKCPIYGINIKYI